MSHTVSNHDEIIDSRDVIDQLETLEDQYQELKDAVQDSSDQIDTIDDEDNEYDKKELIESYESAKISLELWEQDNLAELKVLRDFAEEGESLSRDWRHGETLIREDYWVDYVKQMLEDCGDLPRDLPDYIEIDWDKTANNIAMDYSTLEFDGVTYYIRSS